MKQYDLIVIGSGGGNKISTPASSLGYKCAIIEKWKWGGTCLNRGCIPSKMLIHPANVSMLIQESKKLGINANIKSIAFKNIITRINSTVGKDSRSIPKWYDSKKNIDYYHGHAKFISDKIVEVNGKKLTAKRIYIATGAKPNIPPIPGLKDTPYMTSTEALRNKKLPKKLIVIGGGYIACELGYAYSALGSDVTFLVRGELLAREDVDIKKEFSKAFCKQQKVKFVKTQNVEYKNKQFIVTTDKGKVKGDGLLVATGIKPKTDNLGLENTNIKTNRGFIKVNKYLETSVKNVFALGDCVGNFMFRHSVNFEGEYLFDSLKKKKPIKYPPMPHAVFTHPEIGSVGMTEQQLIDKKIPYYVGMNKYISSAMGMARVSDYGLVKLIFHKKTNKLIGAHIVGEEASNMIHQLIYAMTFNATRDDLLKMIYIHPALPEIVRNAVRNT